MNRVLSASEGAKFIGGSGKREYRDTADQVSDFARHPVPVNIMTISIIRVINDFTCGNIPDYLAKRAALKIALQEYVKPLTS
jgi:hypothetical protein